MLNFKKVLGVAKRTICAALSAVMVLNMFSACADDEIITYKVALVGNDQSGKTAFRRRITQNGFSEEYEATIGVEFVTKSLQTEDKNTTIKLQLWDTAGQERFRNLVPFYCKCADLVLLTVPYDKPSDEVDKYLNYWVGELNRADISCNVKIVLTKNEPNLPGYNSSLKEDIKEFISKHNKNLKMLFAFEEEVIETSAKNNNGIAELEDYIVNYLTQKEQESLNNDTATLPNDGADDSPQTEDLAPAVADASACPQNNNKKWIIGGGIGTGALLIPAAAILIHKFCHKTPAPKKLA